jgi:molybdate transport system ATP-binding protein
MTLRADLGLTHGDFTLGIAITVEPGRTVALLGPNGAGKSTAVAALAGLLRLDSGRIELGGRVLDEPNTGAYVPPEERRIGIAFQDGALFPHLSALDNVAFGPRSTGVARGDARRTAAEWLDRFEIGERAEALPGRLSGGEAQRVAVARALAAEPRLLILDEPFASLDVSTRAATRRLVTDVLADLECPSIVITHDPAEAFLVASTVHVIEDGAIVQTGSPEELRIRPQTPYVADLVGVNRFEGVAATGTVTVGTHALTAADTSAEGRVLVAIHPRAVSIHRGRPEGSPRNAWETTVLRSEHYGDRVRLQLGVPLTLTAEITPGAEESLGITEGSVVWVSIKATEVELQPE